MVTQDDLIRGIEKAELIGRTTPLNVGPIIARLQHELALLTAQDAAIFHALPPATAQPRIVDARPNYGRSDRA